MKLVVGIGNPGSQYEDTRHNAGFLLVDRLAGPAGLLRRRWTHGAQTVGVEWARVRLGDVECALVKPHTFVNRTGAAVRAAFERYDVAAGDLLVVSDDVHLELGRLRLRGAGSAGGHNGLKSVIEALGTEEFARLRLGVGPAPGGSGSLAEHVLGPFTDSERQIFDRTLEAASRVCERWVREGLQAAQDEWSRWTSTPNEE